MSTAPFNPTPNGHAGRDGRGRFAKGNPGGPGNPLHKRMALFRQTLLAAVTPEDVRQVVGQVVEQAKAGQPWAVREFLDRCVGKPLATMELTGAEGEPLGPTVQVVQAAVLEALADLPEAKLRVAARQIGRVHV